MKHYTGFEYLLIDAANNYGLDKELFEDRITWSKTNVVNNLKDEDKLQDLMEEADNPFLFRKACYAIDDALKGKPTGHTTALDCTASGIQIMAVLAGCKKTAEEVNLIDPTIRKDLYQNMAEAMNAHGFNLAKGDIKKAVMTTFYGSKAEPKALFGEDTDELKAYYKTLSNKLPGAVDVLSAVQQCWRSDQAFHQWTLPDGHVAHVKVINKVEKRIEVDELDGATFTYQFRENSPAEYGISLIANVVHSIDSYVVREMVRRSKKQEFELLCIHDSFQASPNRMNNVRQFFIDIMCELADSTLLQDILREITGNQHLTITKTSNDLSTYIKNSEYGLS